MLPHPQSQGALRSQHDRLAVVFVENTPAPLFQQWLRRVVRRLSIFLYDFVALASQHRLSLIASQNLPERTAFLGHQELVRVGKDDIVEAADTGLTEVLEGRSAQG